MRQLTTTSYAILGLLAVRPRSAYDLVNALRRSNVRLLWPRAESKLYEEPKNLVAHGLARVRAKPAGARSRAVYQISARGRRALARWLDEPGAGLLMEFEAMVKVVYGDLGTRAQLLASIRRIREGVARGAERSLPLVRELAEVGPQTPERAHVIAIADRFLVDVLETTHRWAEWAERLVERWPGTILDARMAAEAHTILRDNAAVVQALAAPPRRAREAARR
jgi:DNA-binding PadR family transcriptional regulator